MARKQLCTRFRLTLSLLTTHYSLLEKHLRHALALFFSAMAHERLHSLKLTKQSSRFQGEALIIRSILALDPRFNCRWRVTT